MRPLVLALLALLLVPVAAAAKEPPVRVLWNSKPDAIRAGGAWDARLSVLQGPGGFTGGRPVIVVTDLGSGAERRVPMAVDVPPNTFRARVAFPRVGFYEVAVAGFDPHDPARFIDVGGPVRIGAPPAAEARGGSWPWVPVVGAAIAALLAAGWILRPVRARRRRDSGGMRLIEGACAGRRPGPLPVGGDELLVDDEGKSRITMEDFAIAMLDEAESPQHPRQRFTAAH